jgi:hypothetical protein
LAIVSSVVAGNHQLGEKVIIAFDYSGINCSGSYNYSISSNSSNRTQLGLCVSHDDRDRINFIGSGSRDSWTRSLLIAMSRSLRC